MRSKQPRAINDLNKEDVVEEEALTVAEKAVQENLDINIKLDKHMDVLKDLQKLDLHHIIKNHGSRLTKLENLNIVLLVRDAIDEQVSVAVKFAMESPLKARFRDLSTFDMKDLLHQRMFETEQHQCYVIKCSTVTL
jgi:hypothetical protein